MTPKTWTLRQCLFFLVGTMCCTALLSFSGYALWKRKKEEKLQNKEYQILAIIQTGPEKEALKTAYLAEILGLSRDAPTQLYAFDINQAEQKLLASPLITKAKIKRVPPKSIYIDYEVRKPIAKLADFENCAIDASGHVFPIHPFFSPKNLPEIYLGMHTWANPVNGSSFTLAKEILEFLDEAPWREGFMVKRIDVANAFATSLGTREVVLITEEEIAMQKGVAVFPKLLRLNPKDFQQQLTHFCLLRKKMADDYKKQLAHFKEGGRFNPRIVDLRIPQLAFVEKS